MKKYYFVELFTFYLMNMQQEFLRNINPEQFNSMKKMMTPQMMKNMTDTFANMNDDQIGSYLSAMGMGHISPQNFRNMSQNLKNMPDNDLEKIKEQTDTNFQPGSFPRYNSSSCPNTTMTDQNAKTKSKPMEADSFLERPKNIAEKVENIKILGNDLYKAGKYKEACEKYYQMLNELEEASEQDRNQFKAKIEDLEIAARLNIASSKLKMEDFDVVIYECSKVLKKSENYKAYYRSAIAHFKKKDYKKAMTFFTKAKEKGNVEEDQAISTYITQCKSFLDDLNKSVVSETKSSAEVQNSDSPAEKPIDAKKNTSSGLQRNEVPLDKHDGVRKAESSSDEKQSKEVKINSQENTKQEGESRPQKSKKIEKFEKIVQKEKRDLQENIAPEIKVEEDGIKVENINTIDGSRNSNMNASSAAPNTSPGFDGNQYNEAKTRLSEMSDKELSGMVEMLKSMDNETLKSMMGMQGMSVSDEQIAFMKSSLTPEMMKMMNNHPMMNQKFQTNTNSKENIERENVEKPIGKNTKQSSTSTTTPTIPNGGFPDVNNMSSMLKYMKDNPEMLKMISPQLGKMFNGNGADPEILMKSMESIIWLFNIPSRMKRFFTSTRGILLTCVFFGLLIAYFYNK